MKEHAAAPQLNTDMCQKLHNMRVARLPEELQEAKVPLPFAGSNSWHTYLYSTANVTYLVMMPIHCMQASLWSYSRVELLYDTMPDNAGNI